MKVLFSSPAKVILSGEHAVVYGKPALASALDLRLRVKICETEKFDTKPKNWEIIEQVVKEFLEKEKIKFKDRVYSVEIDSEIPFGRGLGSSAAFSTASVAGLLKFLTGKNFEKEVINNLAYKVEKHFHGKPSGIDNSTSCFGGLIFFRKEFEFLKVISRLNFKIPQKIEKRLYLIDTGKPFETTAEMVEKVGRLLNEKPKKTRQILSEIERITKQIVVSIVKEDLSFFTQAVEQNEKLLEMLGVVSKTALKRLNLLKDYGVFKITGAGGEKGPVGFVLFVDLKGKGEEGLEKLGWSYFKFKFDDQGLREEDV